MNNQPKRTGLFVLTFAAALGTALVTGTYLAFSVMVMPGLKRLDPETGTAAMQAINEPAFGPAFQLLFSGTSVLCFAAGLAALLNWDGRRSLLVLVGALLTLFAGIAVTGAVHIPLTYELAEVDARQATASQWNEFTSAWAPWNHVRSVAGIAAAVALFLGLPSRREPQSSVRGAQPPQ